MKKRLFTLAMVSAVAAFGLAGCGSSSADKTADKITDTSTEDGVKKVEIALVAGNAPYTYLDEDSKPAGYDYEVLKLIDDYLEDFEFNYTVIDYDSGLIGTKEGKYDLNAGAYFRTDAREKTYLISDPYNYFFLNLVVPEGSQVKSLKDMNGLTLAPIVATDGRYAALSDWEKENPDIKINMEDIAEAGTLADEVAGVHDGTYDAAYMAKEQAQAIFDEVGYTLDVTDIVGGRDTTFLMNQDDSKLQEGVNEAIEALTKDNTIPKLTETWFGQDNFAKASELGLR